MLERMMKLVVLLGFVAFSSGQNPYFWQTADPHFDPTYATTKDSCYEPIPADLGDYGNSLCDAPYRLIRSSFRAMKDNGPDPAFVLYSGDTQGHPKNYDPAVFNEEYILRLHRNISSLITEFFPTSKSAFTIGNHDYNPRNLLPGEQNSQYESLAQIYNLDLGDTGDLANMTYFLKGGFYTQLLTPGKPFRIAVLNTNLYLRSNSISQGQEYTEKQFTWLEEVLAKAKAEGEIVYLFAHVPPGTATSANYRKSLRDEDNSRINAIIRKYGEVIKGMFSAHDHMDTFRIYYREDTPVTAMLLAPSVTPWISRGFSTKFHHNPAVRKIFFDESTGELTDVEQYYLDLEEANKNPGSVQWKKLYSFKDFYDLDDVSAASLDKLVQKFKDNPSSTFEDWYKKRGAGDIDAPLCDCSCKTSFICSMENVDYSEFDECEKEAKDATCAVSGLFHLTSVVMLVLSALITFLL